MVGFNRRFDPAHRRCARRSPRATLGDVHVVRITSRDPEPPPLAYIAVSGGIFLDMTIHDFDMARFVTGSEVVEVYARGAVRVDPAIGEAGDVDTAVVMLRHADGALTLIDNSRQAVYGFDQRVEAFGSLAWRRRENPLAHAGLRAPRPAREPPAAHFFLERYIPSYLGEWHAFVAAVARRRPVAGERRRRRGPRWSIGLAAWRSLREGRVVRVAEIVGAAMRVLVTGGAGFVG